MLMKNEIRKLFPLEFYINDKGRMVSEISLKTLNKLSDEIIKLQDENDRHFKEAIRYENACDELEIRIDKAIEYNKYIIKALLNCPSYEKDKVEDMLYKQENILKGSDEDE